MICSKRFNPLRHVINLKAVYILGKKIFEKVHLHVRLNFLLISLGITSQYGGVQNHPKTGTTYYEIEKRIILILFSLRNLKPL